MSEAIGSIGAGAIGLKGGTGCGFTIIQILKLLIVTVLYENTNIIVVII